MIQSAVMLTARSTSNGQIAVAYFESKRNGPFTCLDCHDLVILKIGKNKVSHFAHAYPLNCQFGTNESDQHRNCKRQIYEALLKEPNVTDVALERSLGTVRPDIYAKINGVRVAIEVQISSLSLETIQYRTIEYHRKGRLCQIWATSTRFGLLAEITTNAAKSECFAALFQFTPLLMD